MAEQVTQSAQQESAAPASTMRRRGLIAGAAALAAGLIASKTAQQTEASNLGTFTLGTGNTTEASTFLRYDGIGTPSLAGVLVISDNNGYDGTYASAIQGHTTGTNNIAHGVYGYSSTTSGNGVIGYGTPANLSTGVAGVGYNGMSASGTAYGLQASASGVGATPGQFTYGLLATNSAALPNAIGVSTEVQSGTNNTIGVEIINNATGTNSRGISLNVNGAGGSAYGIYASNNNTGSGNTGIYTKSNDVGMRGDGVNIGVTGYIPNTASANNAVGVFGNNFSTGSGSIGVNGYANGPSGTGVKGSGPSGTGVYGIGASSASGIGVEGDSYNTGVLGITSFGSTINNTTAVSGSNFSTGTGGIGVRGFADGATAMGVSGVSNSGVGVKGTSSSNDAIQGNSGSKNGVYGTTSGTGLVAGLYGTSSTAYGIIGNTTAPFYSGLTATTNTPNCAAFAATSTNAGAFAAYFTGFTYVQGSFAVSGNKSAAVMHPDGTRRLFYCVESPEAWFEDFGEAKLVNGKAEVKIDPEFATFVVTADYHVFLTPAGDCKGLFATSKSAGGFSVRELQGGASSLSFSWRVVAKRKDNPGKRLEKLHVPKFILPDPDKLPKPEPAPAIVKR